MRNQTLVHTRKPPPSLHKRRPFGRHGWLYVISEPARASIVEQIAKRSVELLIVGMLLVDVVLVALIVRAASQ